MYPWELIVAAINRSGLVEPITQAFPITLQPQQSVAVILETGGKIFLPYFAKLVCEPSGIVNILLAADDVPIFYVEGCDLRMFDYVDFTRLGFPWVAKKNMALLLTNTSTDTEAYISFVYGGGLMSADAYRILEERLWARVREWLLSESRETR